jgi:hypothetical protein
MSSACASEAQKTVAVTVINRRLFNTSSLPAREKKFIYETKRKQPHLLRQKRCEGLNKLKKSMNCGG